MFGTDTQRATKRASLRGISGVDVLNGNPDCLRFVLDKDLQLSESPTVQAGSYALPAFDIVSDVSKVFKNNLTRSNRFGFFDNRFTHFVEVL